MYEVVKTFTNKDFGKLRVVCIDNEFFLISKDLGEFLGYVNISNAVVVHVDKKDRKHCLINTSFGIQKMVVVNRMEFIVLSIMLSHKEVRTQEIG